MADETNENMLDLSNLSQWLPLPYLIVERNGFIVHMNSYATEFLKKACKSNFTEILNINKIVIDPNQFTEIIKDLNRIPKRVIRKLLVRFKSDEISILDITACYLGADKEKVFIYFNDISTVDTNFYGNLVKHYKQEIHKLKPYLNKAGQEMQNQLLLKNFMDEALIKTPTLNNRSEIIHEQRMEELSKIFPVLTQNELIICSLLSLKLSYEEISDVTKKNTNSLRVAVHRIFAKLKFKNASEFFNAISGKIS